MPTETCFASLPSRTQRILVLIRIGGRSMRLRSIRCSTPGGRTVACSSIWSSSWCRRCKSPSAIPIPERFRYATASRLATTGRRQGSGLRSRNSGPRSGKSACETIIFPLDERPTVRATPARRTDRAFKSTLVHCTRGFENGSRKEGSIRAETVGRQESQTKRPQTRQDRAPNACVRRVFRASRVFQAGSNGVARTHVSPWLR
jgi:hypothetical protein